MTAAGSESTGGERLAKDAKGDAVLDAAAGVGKLALDEDVAAGGFGEGRDADHGGVADGVEDAGHGGRRGGAARDAAPEEKTRETTQGGGPRVAAVVIALGRESERAGSAAATATPPRTAPNAAEPACRGSGTSAERRLSGGRRWRGRARRAPAMRNVVARPEEVSMLAEDASLDPRSPHAASARARVCGKGRHRR